MTGELSFILHSSSTPFLAPCIYTYIYPTWAVSVRVVLTWDVSCCHLPCRAVLDELLLSVSCCPCWLLCWPCWAISAQRSPSHFLVICNRCIHMWTCMLHHWWVVPWALGSINFRRAHLNVHIDLGPGARVGRVYATRVGHAACVGRVWFGLLYRLRVVLASSVPC